MHRFVSTAAVAIVLVLPAASQAATIGTLASFSIGGTIVSFDSTILQPFDDTLGTLERVDIDIEGSLVIQMPTAIVPGGTPGTFVPYPYLVSVENDFRGAFGNLFDFEPEAGFLFAGTASGAGETVVTPRQFSYSFTFDSFTDAIGSAAVTTTGVEVPPLASGLVEDFLPAIHGQHVLDARFIASFRTGIPMPVTMSGGGFIQATYTYTEDAQPVPEPASWFLAGSTALALAAVRSRLAHSR